MPLIFDSFTETTSTDGLQHLRVPGEPTTLCGKPLQPGDAGFAPSCPACRTRRGELILKSWGAEIE